MNNPVNYWDPTGRIPEEVEDELYYYIINFMDFYRGEINGEYYESWYYEYLNYYAFDILGSELYEEHTSKTEKIEIWIEYLYEEWLYRGTLKARYSDVGEIIDENITKDVLFYLYSYRFYEVIITAEQMMYENYELLVQYGSLINPGRSIS